MPCHPLYVRARIPCMHSFHAYACLFQAIVGTFYPGNRGALYTAAIILYALTAVIAGYVSTSLYLSLGGTKWATNAVLTAGMQQCTQPFAHVRWM